MKLKKYPNSQPLQNTHIKIHTKREISFLFLFSQKKIENIYRKSPILSSPICHCPCPASTTTNYSQYTMPLLALSTVSRYQPEHKGPKGIIKQMELGPNQTKQQSNKPRSNTNKQKTKINPKQAQRNKSNAQWKSNNPNPIIQSKYPRPINYYCVN